MSSARVLDCVVVGGGPAGATAANDLARAGREVALLDRAGRIKPCGGAIPPQLMREFDIPEYLLSAHATSACIVSPTQRRVDMPIARGGFVGMVDREIFDEWLRERAGAAGALRVTGTFKRLTRDNDGVITLEYTTGGDGDEQVRRLRTRSVVGADGASSPVARSEIPEAGETPCVYAYHEIVKAPTPGSVTGFDGGRCEVHYRGTISPDFYGWVFPHGDTISIGSGTAGRGFSLRAAVTRLRAETGLAGLELIRREGAPIPMKPLKRWDNGRDVVLAGDASGVVAPASGEGIYYAMTGGRLAADAILALLETGKPRVLAQARKRFMRAHGRVFWVLGIMQRFWYSNDRRRERFVSMCKDKDVQHLTWEAYLNKRLVRARPLAHARIFLKDMAHLMGIVTP
jgi:geranylgeranyl reductase